MTLSSATTFLKFANLQMAAESVYEFNARDNPDQMQGIPLGAAKKENGKFVGAILPDLLTLGNTRASRFTPIQAAEFASQWTIVEHLSNTATGFSGTLFKALKNDPAMGIKQGELVLSFRSTEFIDDAARDNAATNALEVKQFGWAFGQIADMGVNGVRHHLTLIKLCCVAFKKWCLIPFTTFTNIRRGTLQIFATAVNACAYEVAA